jgi:hypothetical protein
MVKLCNVASAPFLCNPKRREISVNRLRQAGKAKADFVKLSCSICDLFVNLNKNDSYYIQLHKEKKVFLVFFLKTNIITNHSH